MAQQDKKFQVEGAEALIRAALEQLDADDTQSLSTEDSQPSSDSDEFEMFTPGAGEMPISFDEQEAVEDEDDEDSILEESLDQLQAAGDVPEQEWTTLSEDEDEEEEEEVPQTELVEDPITEHKQSLNEPAAGVGSERMQALEAEVRRLTAELQEERDMRLEEEEKSKSYYENYVRVSADLENLRKRNNREKAEMRKYGHESALRDLLPVLDNLERAMDTTFGEVPESLREGIDMIYRQFLNVFEKLGAKRFNSQGEPFDYTLHEAISIEMTNDVPPDHVYKEFQAGYLLHDRLLRPAMVVVAKAAPAPAPVEEEEEEVAETQEQTAATVEELPTAEATEEAETTAESPNSEE